MRILLYSALLLTTPARSLPPRAAPKVYVCISTTSYAYHSNQRCSGLGRCTHEVKGMSTACIASVV